MVVKLYFRQATLRRFPIAVAQVLSRFLHGDDNLIQGNLSRVAQEGGEVDGVDGTHGGYSVPFNARDLHQAADGVTGEPQMVLNGDLRGVFDLVQGEVKELR